VNGLEKSAIDKFLSDFTIEIKKLHMEYSIVREQFNICINRNLSNDHINYDEIKIALNRWQKKYDEISPTLEFVKRNLGLTTDILGNFEEAVKLLRIENGKESENQNNKGHNQ